MDFLYTDAGQCYFMNPDTYEQVAVAEAVIGPAAQFLLPEMRLAVEFIEGQPMSVIFPDVIDIRVADTAPAAHSQQDSTWKTAVLENGVEIMVPQFIKVDDYIRIDLTTMKYMERAKPPK
jgi:elongation factor P